MYFFAIKIKRRQYVGVGTVQGRDILEIMIKRDYLNKHYVDNKKSASWIAKELNCSENKVNYWLNKHKIKKRTKSESQYVLKNPKGNPFHFKRPICNSEWFLYGLGLGLWWGEGNKVSKTAIRLGNTDPDLLNYFLFFLRDLFHVNERRLRFGLQIFSDIDPQEAQKYWCSKLKIKKEKFQKIIVSKPISKGTYTRKSRYGVLTIYFSNTKIRDSIYDAIEQLRRTNYANIAQSVERIHGGSQ